MWAAELGIVTPQSLDWGAFDCGDPRIDKKLLQVAAQAALGLQVLYELNVEGELQPVITLCAGNLQAPVDALAVLVQTTDEIPALHIEVLATRSTAQHRGYGGTLVRLALNIGDRLRQEIGLRTVSLEAIRKSVKFYQQLGFEQASTSWPDGSRAMWYHLG